MKWISSNKYVWGVGLENQVMIRIGIQPNNPMGTAWKKMGEAHLTQIDAFESDVRGVEYEPEKNKTESKNTTVWEWNKYGAPEAKGEQK